MLCHDCHDEKEKRKMLKHLNHNFDFRPHPGLSSSEISTYLYSESTEEKLLCSYLSSAGQLPKFSSDSNLFTKDGKPGN